MQRINVPILGTVYYRCNYKTVTKAVIRDMLKLADEKNCVVVVLECKTGAGCIYTVALNGEWVLHATTKTV